jgi:hypothetical protein
MHAYVDLAEVGEPMRLRKGHPERDVAEQQIES